MRARKLAEAGLLDDALKVVDATASASGTKPTPAALLRARGLACFLSRTDYARAATLLEQSAKLDAKEAAHDLFFAARALSRAQDDRTAIVRYEAVARQFPASAFAEEALYQAARLRFLLGQWDAAAKAYRDYLGRAPEAAPRAFRGSRPVRTRAHVARVEAPEGSGALVRRPRELRERRARARGPSRARGRRARRRRGT